MAKISETINLVSKKCGVQQATVANVLDAFCEVLAEELTVDHPIKLGWLGAFKLKARVANDLYNPRTGELYQRPATSVIKFIPLPAIKEELISAPSGGPLRKKNAK